MELRVLEYFLAVAREQSISGAAEYLHLTQPTLSRQLRELEEELGCTLLVRGKRGQRTALTPEGRLFRQRAQEILDLASKPGGVDLRAAGELGLTVIWALSLPGKVAPVTAGGAIRSTIYNMLHELDV